MFTSHLESLSLKTLNARRNIRILKKVYDIKKCQINIPNSWFKHFKFYNNRNGTFLNVPKTRINTCGKNFIVNACKLFNSLPISVRNNDYFSAFYKLIDECYI